MGQSVKNGPTNAEGLGSVPGSKGSPGGGKWKSTLVFLPGESRGQRSLVGYSPWGRKGSDTTEHARLVLSVLSCAVWEG